MTWISTFGTVYKEVIHMAKEILKLLSSLAILAAVIIGVKHGEKMMKLIKNATGRDDDIIDI